MPMPRPSADPGAPSGPARQPRIPARALELFCRLAAETGGLSVTPDREDFLLARLGPEVARLGLSDFAAYAELLGQRPTADVLRGFSEALATHTTSFFREEAQYDWLRTEGIELLAARRLPGPLRIWSAACSSGQELYSALMTAADAMADGPLNGRLEGIGTDISTRILSRARGAIYSGEEIGGIPLAMRRRWLLSDREGRPRHRISGELRGVCRWGQINLAEPSSLVGIRADLAMLRNVLIYFDRPTRDRVVGAVVERLTAGGVLMTGHSEAIRPESFGLSTLRPSIYRKER